MINIDTRLLDLVDANEAWLMLHLARYFNQNNRCWPSNVKLLEATKWSSNTLLRTKRSLIEKGLLTCEQRYREDGSKSTNTYTFNTKMIGVFVNAAEFKEDAKNDDTTPQNLHSTTPQNLQGAPTQNCTDNEVLVREVLTNRKEDNVVLANDAAPPVEKKKDAVPIAVKAMTNIVINYLNEKTARAYKPDRKETTNLIHYWMKQGIRENDFKMVVDYKVGQWLNDEKMSEYLRPQTLFQRSKFRDYLEAAGYPKITHITWTPKNIKKWNGA